MKLYGLELLAVSQHPDKFGDHRPCDNRDLMFLVCNVTSRDHLFKGFCDFTDGRPSP